MTKRLLSVVLGVALLGGCEGARSIWIDGGNPEAPDAPVVVHRPDVVSPSPEDARQDASITDASPSADFSEAGGLDEAIEDASISEAGSGEAGVTEAGITEAGVTEAGLTEAGATETGPALGTQMVYVGCKMADSSGDLRIFSLSPATGELTSVGSYAPGSALSFPAVHPSHEYLYVTKSAEDKVLSLAIDQKTGLLTDNGESAVILPEAGVTGAANPVYAHVDSAGAWLIVTTYNGNNVNVFELDADGKVGALVAKHSMGIHAHSAMLDPSGRFLFVPYHGSDIIGQYVFDAATGAIAPNPIPSVSVGAGEGPRHLDFHPNGRWVYVLTETLANVQTYAFDAASGILTQIQSVQAVLPTYTGKRLAADIHVAKAGPTAGRFVYVSNREEQSLVVYAINQTDGRLTEIQHVDLLPNKTPRNFCIDENGRFLLESNQDSANIATYAIDQSTGQLTKLEEYPVCTQPYFVLSVSL